MRRDIEVEVRGPLQREGHVRLRELLRKHDSAGIFGNRLSLMYFRDTIPQDSNDIKDEKIDLRLRITNGTPELVLKYGLWGGSDVRKEFQFPIKKEEFTKWIEFLRCLGWTICVAYATKHEKYAYAGIEFTLVEIMGVGHSFEAEMLVEDDPAKVEEAKRRILSVCQELGLREYEPGEFERQCDRINNTIELQYDFRKTDPSVIQGRFGEFF